MGGLLPCLRSVVNFYSIPHCVMIDAACSNRGPKAKQVVCMTTILSFFDAFLEHQIPGETSGL